MKAVAAALVLIAGAAVVLWYGNTLNSWVLGGLIGGLAALLLSIPISLTLFAYLSRRHDERLKAEAEVSHVQVYDSPDVSPRRMRRTYEARGYALPEGQSLSDEEIYEAYYRQSRVQAARHLPVPSVQRFPVQSQSSDYLPVTQRGMHAPIAKPSTRQLPSNAPLVEQRDPASKRVVARRMNYPGFPGYVPGYSKHRSEALRTARLEAARDHDDDIDVLPTHFSRPLPLSQRFSQPLAGQTDRLQPQRVDEEARLRRRPRSRRTVDSVPSQNGLPRSLPPAGGSSVHDDPSFPAEPHTDYLDENSYPQTGPVHQVTRTGHLKERVQSSEENSPDVTTGNFTRPLVRRAPYLYADDALRQELAQQIDGPVTRRSSRLEGHLQRNEYDD